MYCQMCQDTGRQGAWREGTRNFRMKTIRAHATSEDHRFSQSATDKAQVTLTKNKEQRKAAFMLALKTAFWIINEEIANMKYKSLLKFFQDLGLADANFLNHAANAQYTSADIFNQLLDSLDFMAKQELVRNLKSSPFVGIGIDESTDRSQEKHVALIVRYVSREGKVITTFLKLNLIKDGTAQSIFDLMTSVLQEFGIRYTKVIGLGADGVNVMSSDMNGLNGLVKVENPFCIYVHCVCHRLALAVSNCHSQIPALSTLTRIVGAVYNYVQYSKVERFKDIAALLDQEALKFKRLFEIRWLCSGESLTTLIRNYEPLLILLGQDAVNGDPVAIGLNAQLSSYKYVALLHLVADILTAVNHLSRLFQHNDVSFAAIRIQLQDCLQTLDGLRTQDGSYLTSMHRALTADNIFKGVTLRTEGGRNEADQRETFRTWREQLLTTLLENLRARFPRIELLDAMQIFEPSQYPSEDRLVAWGNNILEILVDHFGQQKTNRDGRRFDKLIDPDRLRGEFLPFKRLVFRNKGEERVVDGQARYHYYRPTELMAQLFGSASGNRQIYPETLKLMAMCMCVLCGNAEAERIFSCQNRIKSKLRTRLTVGHLDQLIRISHAKREHFPFGEALEQFLQKERRL